jgi:hypothetical protein
VDAEGKFRDLRISKVWEQWLVARDKVFTKEQIEALRLFGFCYLELRRHVFESEGQLFSSK